MHFAPFHRFSADQLFEPLGHLCQSLKSLKSLNPDIVLPHTSTLGDVRPGVVSDFRQQYPETSSRQLSRSTFPKGPEQR